MLKHTGMDNMSFGSIFSHWGLVDGNPLDTASTAYSIVAQIRKRKGLKEGIPTLDNFLSPM